MCTWKENEEKKENEEMKEISRKKEYDKQHIDAQEKEKKKIFNC